MNNKEKKWTPDEDKVLIGMYGTHNAVKEISKILDRPTKSIIARIYFLRSNGIIKPTQRMRWTENKDKELATIIQKTPGNIRAGLREFADANNTSFNAVQQRYYKIIINKYPILSVFGRHRNSFNKKNFNKKESKGHRLWNIIKSMFN